MLVPRDIFFPAETIIWHYMKRVCNRPLLHIPTHMHNGKTLFSLKADRKEGHAVQNDWGIKTSVWPFFYLIKIYLLDGKRIVCITSILQSFTHPMTCFLTISIALCVTTANTSAETCCSAQELFKLKHTWAVQRSFSSNC